MIDKDVAGALNCAEEFFRWMENQPGVSMEDMQIKVLELVMGVEKGLFAGTVKYAISYRRNYIHELQACTDMEGMKKWFWTKPRRSATTWKVQGKKRQYPSSKKQSPISGTITKRYLAG